MTTTPDTSLYGNALTVVSPASLSPDGLLVPGAGYAERLAGATGLDLTQDWVWTVVVAINTRRNYDVLFTWNDGTAAGVNDMVLSTLTDTGGRVRIHMGATTAGGTKYFRQATGLILGVPYRLELTHDATLNTITLTKDGLFQGNQLSAFVAPSAPMETIQVGIGPAPAYLNQSNALFSLIQIIIGGTPIGDWALLPEPDESADEYYEEDTSMTNGISWTDEVADDGVGGVGAWVDAGPEADGSPPGGRSSVKVFTGSDAPVDARVYDETGALEYAFQAVAAGGASKPFFVPSGFILQVRHPGGGATPRPALVVWYD